MLYEKAQAGFNAVAFLRKYGGLTQIKDISAHDP
jgi:hypothetical protein